MNKDLKHWIKENRHLLNYAGDVDGYPEWLLEQPSGKFFNLNLYALRKLIEDKEFRSNLLLSSHLGMDGVGASFIVWLALGVWKKPFGYKVWGPRYLQALRNQKILLIGGTSEEACQAKRKVQEIVHSSNVVFCIDGYSDFEFYLKKVSEISPTQCFVGMGMGLQESIVSRLFVEGSDCKWFACGGWLKQLSGLERNCPNIIARVGLEWLWRSVGRPGHFTERVVIPFFRIFT